MVTETQGYPPRERCRNGVAIFRRYIVVVLARSQIALSDKSRSAASALHLIRHPGGFNAAMPRDRRVELSVLSSTLYGPSSPSAEKNSTLRNGKCLSAIPELQERRAALNRERSDH
jgi:hypothetical protein